MKRLIVNIFAFLVIVIGGLTLTNSSSQAVTSTIQLDKCGECETPDKCCSLRPDGSCFTHQCF